MNKEQFETLSPSEKRVEIAKDVVASIRKGQYYACSGVYVHPNYTVDCHDDEQFQNLLKNNEVTCSVCAIGACFMSLIRFTNNLTVGEYHSSSSRFGQDNDFRRRLEEYFPPEQLGLIEAAFEQAEGFALNMGVDSGLATKAMNFRTDEEDDEDALIRICENITENNGEFIP